MLVSTIVALATAASGPERDRPHANSKVDVKTTTLDVTESESSIRVRLRLGSVGIRERFFGAARGHEIQFEHSERLGVANAPDLPVIRRWFAVPECTGIEADITVHSQRDFSNIVLRSLARSEARISDVPDHPPRWRERDRWFPSEWTRVIKQCHIRGQNMALVEFSPVRYSRSERKLLVADDTEIELRFMGARSAVHTDAGPMQALVDLLASNPTETTPSLPSGASRLRPSSGQGAYKWCMGATESDWQATADSVEAFGADYVIIVADELVQHDEDSTKIESLASHRASSNLFNVAIVPMHGIDADPDTFQTPITIRDFIKTVYESETAPHMADGRLAFVLLLGDAFNPDRDVLIPGYYGFPTGIFDLQGFLKSSDAYYSLLSEDPITDDLPEVFLGRLPVDHDDGHWELANVVNNILDYEPLPFESWTDRILMVSGGSLTHFTFEDEGGAGFENFFDSIDAHYIPPSKSVIKMHRLTSGLGNIQFSKAVSDSVKHGFGLLAMFDHGNYFELAGSGSGGCVLPKDYDTLYVQEHPLVFAIGSYLGTFDYTRHAGPTCCTSSSPSATCLQVPVTPLDPCDVLAERMVLQPGGAIGVFGYCRSQHASFAQGDFINLFRALFEENSTRLGDLLLAARFLQAWEQTTLKGLTLFGDPALNILWRESTSDTLDLAVASSGIRTPSETDYVSSNGPNTLKVTSQNTGPEVAADVLLEVWDGHPDSTESVLLDSARVDVVGYGTHEATVSFGALSVGPHEIHVTLDPDEEMAEPTRDNNIARRVLYAQPNHTGFPAKIKQAGAYSLQIADVHSSPGKELLFATYSEQVVGILTGAARCYSSSTGQELWHLTRGDKRITGPAVATIGKDGQALVYWEAETLSSSRRGYLLSPSTGAVVDSFPLNAQGATYHGQSSALHDLDPRDTLLEVVRLKFASNGTPTLVGLDLDGAELWSATLSVGGLDVLYGGIGVADIDADGSQEVVACAGSSLTVRSGRDGSLEWSKSIGSFSEPRTRSVAFVDGNDDGRLEVVVNGYNGGSQPRLFAYDYDGTKLWAQAVEDSVLFAVGDLDNDGGFEIVAASRDKLRILGANGVGIDSTTLAAGRFISRPLLADVSGDDDLEVVLISHVGGNLYFPDWIDSDLHRLTVFDRDLDLVGTPFTFPAMQDLGGRIADPAIRDMDGDGDAELAFISRDAVLHVLEMGSGTGSGDWTSTYANAMRTNLVEQPLGGVYPGAVSLFNRCFVRGDATFDTLYVDMTADIFVSEIDAESSGSDTDQCEIVVRDRLAVIGSATDKISFHIDPTLGDSTAWVGMTVDTLAQTATLKHFTLRNAQTGFLVKSAASVTVQNGVIEDCSERGVSIAQTSTVVIDSAIIRGADYGIKARKVTNLVVSNSVIEDCTQYGVDIRNNSKLNLTDTSFDGNGIATYLAKEGGSWVKGTIRGSTYTGNAHGIWVHDAGDSTVLVENCTLENQSTTGMYLYAADVVVDSTTLRGAQFGMRVTSGTALSLSHSAVEDASFYGILVDPDDATIDVSSTSFDGNDTGLALADGASWVRGTIRDCTFTNNGDGIWIYDVGDSSVVVDDCVIDDNTTNGIYVEDGGDVTISRNTITNNAIGVYSYGSNPTIRSRNVIQYNTGGIKCDGYSTAVVESSTVNNNTNGVHIVNGANPDLGHESGGNSLGQNIMRPNTTYHVLNMTSNGIVAENNYWPRNPPTQCNTSSTKFYGSVDNDPHLGCDAPALSPPSSILIAAEEENGEPRIPTRFSLRQNYPNPFNPATTVAYEVPKPGSRVEIALYDVGGRLVAVLIDEHRAPGFYSVTWNGINRNGEPVASGVYFLRMRAGHFVDTKKLLLLK